MDVADLRHARRLRYIINVGSTKAGVKLMFPLIQLGRAPRPRRKRLVALLRLDGSTAPDMGYLKRMSSVSHHGS